MMSENLQQSLKAIKEYISGIARIKEDDEVKIMKNQLSLLKKSISKFEKDGVLVPEGMRADMLSLESKIRQLEKGPQELSFLYEEMLDIVFQIGCLLSKRPDKDIRKRIRESKKTELASDILRKNIINVLLEMGGSAYERDIRKAIEERLRENFTPADKRRPFGRSMQWEINLRKERFKMIKDGILTPDSKGNKWTLAPQRISK